MTIQTVGSVDDSGVEDVPRNWAVHSAARAMVGHADVMAVDRTFFPYGIGRWSSMPTPPSASG